MSNLTNEPHANWLHFSLYMGAFVIAFGGLLVAPDRDTALLLFWGGLGFGLLVMVFTTDWRQEFREIRQWLPWLGLTVTFAWSINEFGFAAAINGAVIFVTLWLMWRATRGMSP